MNYIRDHCKFIAFDVIKARIDPMNTEDPYTTSTEMIQELHSHFGDFNKFILCDAELHDPAFTIRIIKKNKTFDEFYARFSATVASLSYIESLKIRALQRLLTLKLRYRIIDNKPTSFRNYVKRARMINQNMRLYTRQFDIKKINKKEFMSETSEGGDAATKHPDKYSKAFKAQLRKSERYLKCLGYDYRPKSEALCANIKHLSYEEAKTRLVNEAKGLRNAIEKD